MDVMAQTQTGLVAATIVGPLTLPQAITIGAARPVPGHPGVFEMAPNLVLVRPLDPDRQGQLIVVGLEKLTLANEGTGADRGRGSVTEPTQFE